MMVAAGWLLVITRSTGITVNWLGASPKLHMSTAPLQTCSGMGPPPLRVRVTGREKCCVCGRLAPPWAYEDEQRAVPPFGSRLRRTYIHLGLCLGTIAILLNESMIQWA